MSTMRRGNHVGDRVYVKDASFAWLPATVVALEQDRARVAIHVSSNWQDTTEGAPSPDQEERWVMLDNYRDRLLPLQNDRDGSTRDCADLPHLHEAAILYQVKERHFSQRPYTRVGEIVVAVNPCQWINGLYSVHQGISYAKNFVWQFESSSNAVSSVMEEKKDDQPITSTSFGSIYNKLGVEPHIYEVSALAYRGMFLDQKNQTILVSGESGAGKTETVKIVLHHLATLETASLLVDNDEWPTNDMIQHIVESCPVFEAFGNAETVRNHNSSRFGKMSRLHFGFQTNGMCGLRGSTCQTYLLETNRVVSQAPGERNFHIFYQLLAAPSSAKVELLGKSWEFAKSTDFLYLNSKGTTKKDAESWIQTRRALEFFEWRDNKLVSLCQALGAILSLGNVVFTEDTETDGCYASPEAIAQAAESLDLDSETLDHALRHKTIQTAGERVDTKLTPGAAKDALDTLVRKIYDVIFQEIVDSVNTLTKDKSFEEEDGIINLLDIYGFEAFETNRFEQLCINYANEMLHKKYIDDNFKRFRQEYDREGIELFDFSLVDNSDVLALLQGHEGVIYHVNEECVLPNGNSESFVKKLKKAQKTHSRLIGGDLMLKTHFGIKHFAAPVVYDASEFVERNMHRLPGELLNVISKTSNNMISSYFKSVLQGAAERLNEAKSGRNLSPGRKRTSKKKAVLERFRVDLLGLMESMQNTETRYIRCVKPNETLNPGKVNHCTVMRQLECAGLVTAIDMTRETYPDKLPHAMVEERFGCLMNKLDKTALEEVPPHDKLQYMLSKLYAPLLEVYRNCEFTMPYACGKTKVYFRSGALEMLESIRFDFYSKWATVIQADMRRCLARRTVERAWKGLISLQALARGYQEKRSFQVLRYSVMRIQAGYKGRNIRQRYLRQRSITVLLQTRWRFIASMKRLKREQTATCQIVTLVQMYVVRKRFLIQKDSCTKIQAKARGSFVRKRFEYVVQASILLQSFGRRIVAKNERKARKGASRSIGKFGRFSLKQIRNCQAATKIQSTVRRVLASNRTENLGVERQEAILVIVSFLKFSTARIKFIKLYVATIKLQTFTRMCFAKMRFREIVCAAIEIQSFCRMTEPRIRFVSAYMAALKLQSFFRMILVLNQYAPRLTPSIKGVLSYDKSEILTIATGDIKGVLSYDKSEILTIATGDSKDNASEDPASGILRSWMAGSLKKVDDQTLVSSNDQSSTMTVQNQDKALMSSESLPSITLASNGSSNTDGAEPQSSEEVHLQSDLPTEESNKDATIRKLRLQLDDMKEQEVILREEIAAVVDLAKEHEQMVGEEYEDRVQAYEDEVVQLKESLKQSQTEKERLRLEVEKLRRDRSLQKESYQRHAQISQESHKDYIRKVSLVLDEANNARKQETSRILAEFDALKKTKEEEIRKLKSEVASLQSVAISTEQLRSTRSSLIGSKNLKSELRQLEQAIMSAIKPDRVAVVVERAERRPWSKEAFIDEKVSLRVSQYVQRLVELANTAETSET